jgi:TrmH family RNA methyltransferase
MLPISKAKLRTFASLQTKKYRQKHGLFVIEGKKMVREALVSGFSIEAILIIEDRQEDNDLQFESVLPDKVFAASPTDFQQISSLQSPEGVLAILRLPETYLQTHSLSQLPPGKGLLLDEIQDPGNLGTLIRTADWFGIDQIICRKGTVDCFNPKVLRSSMGSIFRVNIIYVNVWERPIQASAQRVWLADMEGEALDKAIFGAEDWLLLGNEANGVDEKLKALPEIRKVHIPGRGGAESLNVGVAGGILMSRMVVY